MQLKAVPLDLALTLYFNHFDAEYFAHCLKNKHWDMAAFLFERRSSIPTEEEGFSEDFVDFVEKNNLQKTQKNARYQLIKTFIEGGLNAAKTLTTSAIEGSADRYMIRLTTQETLYVISKTIEALNKTQGDPAKRDINDYNNRKQILGMLLQNYFDNTFFSTDPTTPVPLDYSKRCIGPLEKIINHDFVDWMVMHGFNNLLQHPTIKTQLNNPETTYNNRALAETAFVLYGQNEMGFDLYSMPYPEEGLPPLSANCLAALLSRGEIDDAIRLINTTDVSLDLSRASFQDMPKGFDKGLVQWAKDTDNTLLITSCPRVKALTASKSILHAHSKVTNPNSFGKRKEKEGEETPEAKKPRRMS